MRLQIVSDLHLEFPKVYGYEKIFIPAVAPVIALVGDIGSPAHSSNGPLYAAFLKELTTRFEKVFVVAGNHEFYVAEYAQVKEKIRKICNENDKLVFLDKTSVLYDNVRILGCTLWSKVPDQHELAVEAYLNDYSCIQFKEPNTGIVRKLRVTDTNRFHEEEISWLQSEIDAAHVRGEKVVVLTHHAPLMTGVSPPQYEGLPTSHGFSTDLSHMMDGDCVKLWGFGHTHFCSDQTCNGTRVVSNQLGYLHFEKVHLTFRPDAVFEV